MCIYVDFWRDSRSVIESCVKCKNKQEKAAQNVSKSYQKV